MPDLLRTPTQSESPCLSDDEVVAFALGRLSSARLATAHEHLDGCETCQRLLSEAAHVLGEATTAPHTGSDEVGWNTTFQPGVVVGRRYRIRHFIARGGMGEVYEAFDDDLQQRVALKTVASTAGDNANAVRRLKAEVQLARRVSHPNVCRIYDFGTHAMGQTGAPVSFLTMEFVDGETLGQCVRLGGALPLVEALRLARQLLLGLSAAHDAGVLHRDFKSDNVMLRAEAEEPVTPLILDFGLARALDHQSQGSVSSSSSTLVGTLDYIAPEQLEGKPHTTASDVYSFGVVWFEMLTGELPFEAGSFQPSSALQRLQKAAPAPSSKNPLVPSGLDAIVLRCLRRAPKDRFRTAGEVLAALEVFDERRRPLWQRRSLLALALTTIAVAVGGYSATRRQPSKPPGETVVRVLNAASPAPLSPLGPAAGAPPRSAPSAAAAPGAPEPTEPAAHLGVSADAVAHLRAPRTGTSDKGSSVSARLAANAAAAGTGHADAGSVSDGAGRATRGARERALTAGSGWENPFDTSAVDKAGDGPRAP